jgi:hypothetical protein
VSDRAVTGAVGKLLELALVVLFVGMLSTALFGGVVPEYRSAAGGEVGERTLAVGAQRVQQAVPPAVDATYASATYRVDLPQTIRGDAYRIHVDGRALVLDHPAPAVGGRVRLAVPTDTTVSGAWASRGDPVIHVTTTEDGPAVRLDA